MLAEDFIPVAIDQWYQRRQQDAEGEYWRKIAEQGPRSDFKLTTQGHYICDASGKLLGFNGNHIDLERIKRFMRKSLGDFDPTANANIEPLQVTKRDPGYDVKPPQNGLVIRMHSKVLGGYEKPKDNSTAAFQNSVGQDNVWITESEKQELVDAFNANGDFPEELAYRIARFCLIDNTRGEPPRWQHEQVKQLDLKINDGVLSGSVKLNAGKENRGYECEVFGYIEIKGNDVVRFDVVAEGDFWGEGRHTRRAPEGKFPLAFTFQLADSSTAQSRAIPHGAKGWVDGYYNASNK